MSNKYNHANDSGDNRKQACLADTFQFSSSYDIALMIVGAIGAILCAATQSVFNVVFGWLLDELNEEASDFSRNINDLCIVITALGTMDFFFSFVQVALWGYSGERQTQIFRERYVNAILSQEVGWFDTCGTGHLSTNVSDLIGHVQDGLGRKIGDVINNGSQFVLSYAVAFYLNWELTLVLIGTLPFIAIMGYFMIKATEAVTGQAMEQYAHAGSVATEALSAMRTVASLNSQPSFIQRYRVYIIEAMQIGIIKGLKLGLGNGGLYAVVYLSFGLGIWYGAKLVADAIDDGDSSPTGGDVIAVFFSVLIGGMALGQLAPPLTAFTKARVAVSGLLEVIDRQPLIDGLSEKGTTVTDKATHPTETQGSSAIEVKDIDFSYPSRPDIQICKQYSLSISAGETVALVGASGSGKSTIVQLLLRFYDPDTGSILLDGTDIRDLNVRWLRSQIGYVGQEPVLFSGSVAENIAYGLTPDVSEEPPTVANSSASTVTDNNVYKKILRSCSGRTDVMARVIEAAKLANAHEFISSFPDGYDTDVGSNGGSMSGGQKQRIAIARALIKKPAVLLLDEATSALDATSERLVQQSIDDLQRRRAQTTIIIAHRLSTIRNADKICVIDEGRIVESGTHDELLALDNKYALLVRTQLTSSTGDNASAPATPIKRLETSSHTFEGKDVLKSAGNENPTMIVTSQENNNINRPDVNKVETIAAFFRVWGLIIKQSFGWFSVSALGSAVFGAVYPVWGYLVAQSQDMFYKSSEQIREESVWHAYYYIILAGAAFVACIMQHWGASHVGERLSLELRSGLFEGLMRREISYFDYETNSVGALTARLATDTRYIDKTFNIAATKQLQALFCLLFSLMIGFTASWQLSLVVLATFPVHIITTVIQMEEETVNVEEKSLIEDSNSIQKHVKRHMEDIDLNEEDSIGSGVIGGSPSAIIATAFMNIRTVSAFSMQHRISEQYAQMTRQRSKRKAFRVLLSGLAFGASNFTLFCSYALLFWFGSTLLEDGDITFEEMMTAILVLMLGALGLGQALSDMGDQKQAIEAASRIFTTIDESRNSAIDGINNTKGVVPATENAVGRIEIKNVQFRYPTRPEVTVCKDYSLTIEPGEVLALVGASGSGKSTIVQLLLRFYDPDTGSILLDGTDIRDLNVRWLRSQIGYVGQEPVLFSGTIRDNLLLGRASTRDDAVLSMEEIFFQSRSSTFCSKYDTKIYPQVDTKIGFPNGLVVVEQDIVDACKASNAYEFINLFQERYDTDVGEKSSMVSGGQKQRIAIARALIKKPAVLLLDEATSALDATSERLVQQSIDDLQRRRAQTTIIIAHRLSTIRNADKICVIDEGRIVESGTHDELLALNNGRGIYASLWAKQDGTA